MDTSYQVVQSTQAPDGAADKSSTSATPASSSQGMDGSLTSVPSVVTSPVAQKPPTTSNSPITNTGSAAETIPTACEEVKKEAATKDSGKAPIQYTEGWTPAPVEGCTIKDPQGRTVVLNAQQNRMLFRVNEMRRAQNAKDGLKRPVLFPDFCIAELSQGYADTKPHGHNPLLMAMYPFTSGSSGSGSGSGSSWINENYGTHSGYTSDPMAAVDQLIYGWFTSGTLTSGHYGNMMNPKWTQGGFGTKIQGASALGIQNFSHRPAMFTYPDGKACSQPPNPLNPDSSVPPSAPPPLDIKS